MQGGKYKVNEIFGNLVYYFKKKTPNKPLLDKYTVKELSGISSREMEQTLRTAKKMANKFLPLIITASILVLFGLIILVSTLSAGLEVGFQTAWGNAAGMIIAGAVSLLLGAVLGVIVFLFKKKDDKKTMPDMLEMLNETYTAAGEELNIPDNAQSIDIYISHYIHKNGQIKYKNSMGISSKPYAVYTDPDTVYFSDFTRIVAIKKSQYIRSFVDEGNFWFTNWSLPLPPADPALAEYKFKIMNTNIGTYFSTPFSGLFLFRDGDSEFGIRVMPYEYERLRAIFTGETPAQPLPPEVPAPSLDNL